MMMDRSCLFMIHVSFFLIMTFSSHAQPWEQHGPLGVSENGHFLVHEDGTPFFWTGDTPWALFTLDRLEGAGISG